MNIKGWKYYNHAAIPTCAPHESPDLTPIEDGSIWKLGRGCLLARWTTDWDCGYETNWWYIICEKPFSINDLSKKSRENIRKALKNCEVKRINPAEYAEDLWRVFQEAIVRYKNYTEIPDKETFIQGCYYIDSNIEYWAGFDRKNNRMIGYKICEIHNDMVNFVTSKYSTEFMKLRASDALNAVTLEHYLNGNNHNIKYVTNGSHSVVHDTNVQDYYQEHFHFRKAYCKLNIKYRDCVMPLINLLYIFRKQIQWISFHSIGKQILGLLRMEEVARCQN